MNVELVHDFKWTRGIVEENVFKFNFAFLDDFDAFRSRFANIKGGDFVDDWENRLGGFLCSFDAGHVTSLRSKTHEAEEEEVTGGEDCFPIDSPFHYKHLDSDQEHDSNIEHATCSAETVVCSHLCRLLFDNIQRPFE